MANPVVRDTYIGAMAPLLFWDGQSVTVYICPFCGYWPINGEDKLQYCKRCKMLGIDPNLPADVYREAADKQWLTPVVVARRKV